MLLHPHARISIIFAISGPTDVKKGIKLICSGYFVLAINFFFVAQNIVVLNFL